MICSVLTVNRLVEYTVEYCFSLNTPWDILLHQLLELSTLHLQYI